MNKILQYPNEGIRKRVIDALCDLNVEELSPIGAITRLYELQRMIGEE